jgi:hypothetical protein
MDLPMAESDRRGSRARFSTALWISVQGRHERSTWGLLNSGASTRIYSLRPVPARSNMQIGSERAGPSGPDLDPH